MNVATIRSLKAAVLLIAYAICVLSVGAANLDGSINGAGDNWDLVPENPNGQPFTGGSTTESDLVAESSTFHRWDGLTTSDVGFDDNRGDVINFYTEWDAVNLYIAVSGPTVPFNMWTNPSDPDGNGDQGDLFIAIDTSGGTPSGGLIAEDGHNSFGGARAVDFEGWEPDYVLGVQFVDNGGGGNGNANLEETGTHNVVAGEAQGQNDGGFDWNADVNGSAGYDTFNGNAGEFEFAIPWTMLGYASIPVGDELRFSIYTTGNFAGSDAYDSATGLGQATVFEQLGDHPGDIDTGGLLGSSDGGFQSGGGTMPDGSFPSANFVGDPLNNAPSRNDEVDTISEWFSVSVPEPSSVALMLLGAVALIGRRRRIR